MNVETNRTQSIRLNECLLDVIKLTEVIEQLQNFQSAIA